MSFCVNVLVSHLAKVAFSMAVRGKYPIALSIIFIDIG